MFLGTMKHVLQPGHLVHAELVVQPTNEINYLVGFLFSIL